MKITTIRVSVLQVTAYNGHHYPVGVTDNLQLFLGTTTPMDLYMQT